MRTSILLALLFLSSCGDDGIEADLLAQASATAMDADAPWPPWTVLEEAGSQRDWTYSIDAFEGPVGRQALALAARSAAQGWTDTGLVNVREVKDAGEGGAGEADFDVVWGRAQGGEPSPFGALPGVALTRTTGSRVLVQLDPARDWWLADLNATSSGPHLVATLTHEFGHVLGLGHTEREDALLAPGSSLAFERPQPADLAGLTSIYGPPEALANPGDLQILASGSSISVAAPIRGLATHGRSAFGLLDWDADGDDEVYIWRTDRAGYCSLMVLDFGPGPRLRQSFGPWIGLSLPGAQAGPVKGLDGRPMFLVRRPENGWLAYSLGANEGLLPFEDEVLELAEIPGDADGDGLLDLSSPEERERFERGLQRRVGDLDGDGRLEELRSVR